VHFLWFLFLSWIHWLLCQFPSFVSLFRCCCLPVFWPPCYCCFLLWRFVCLDGRWFNLNGNTVFFLPKPLLLLASIVRPILAAPTTSRFPSAPTKPRPPTPTPPRLHHPFLLFLPYLPSISIPAKLEAAFKIIPDLISLKACFPSFPPVFYYPFLFRMTSHLHRSTKRHTLADGTSISS